jgi:hypothetical protein
LEIASQALLLLFFMQVWLERSLDGFLADGLRWRPDNIACAEPAQGRLSILLGAEVACGSSARRPLMMFDDLKVDFSICHHDLQGRKRRRICFKISCRMTEDGTSCLYSKDGKQHD